MSAYFGPPEACKTLNDTVNHPAKKGMFKGCYVLDIENATSVQVNNLSKYLSKWLNNNTQKKKHGTIGINNKLFFINRLLGNHFPGKALIGYNPDIAMAVTLMSITGCEITMDHVKGLVENFKRRTPSINMKFFKMELDLNFVWPPCDIGTFNYDIARIVSDHVSPEVIEKLKMSVSHAAEGEGEFLSPDETEVLDVLMSMDVYSSDALSLDETDVLDILMSMDVHESKKRMIEDNVFVFPPIIFGGEGYAFKSYKKQ
jgi:hypothetical protein